MKCVPITYAMYFSSVISRDLLERKPIRRTVVGQAAPQRINIKSKEFVECRMEWPQTECAVAEKVPVECFEMSDVKNDAVSFRNRPVIENLRPRDAKDRVRVVAGLSQALEEANPASSRIGMALR